MSTDPSSGSLSLGGGGHAEPRVPQDTLQGRSLGGPDPETPVDQVLQGLAKAERRLKVELGGENVVIVFKGYVTAYHDVEEDTQRPDCGRQTLVLVVPYPFRRGVHPGTVEIRERFISHVCPGTEIN